MFFRLRRREVPWEVVESRFIDPVPIYYEDRDLDLLCVGDEIVQGRYIFDLKPPQAGKYYRSAVAFARQQLLQDNAKHGFNTLLLESWDLTLYRKEKQHRIEVKYSGRPALSNSTYNQVPPFMGILDN